MAVVWIAGCGDLGRTAGALLAASGHEVVGLRRRVPETGAEPGLNWVSADLTDPASLSAVEGRPDHVVYTAAAPSLDEAGYRATYVDGVRNLRALLDERESQAGLVFVSSSAVHGDAGGGWVDETVPCRPDGFRGAVLLEAEAAALEWPGGARVARLTGLYGPGRTALVERVKAGRPCRAGRFGNRIHRDDAARMLVHLMNTDSGHRVFLGVDHEPAPECEVMRWLAARLGVADPETVQEGTTERGNKRCSNARLLGDGFRFQYPSYREGFDALIDHGGHA